MIWIATYLLAGALVGFLAGLLGIGGGMTLVPILAALFAAQALAPDYGVHLALGTGMASMVFTSFVSVRAHHALGSIDWSLVRRFAPGMLAGALASSLATGWFSERTLAMCYALAAGLGAVQMLRRAPSGPARGLPRLWASTLVMAVIGAICGLMSAGGAFLTVPFMVWCGVSMRSAIGTGAALGWPLAVVGTIGYVLAGLRVQDALPPHTLGFVLLPALAALVLASMLFAPLGARCMHRLPVQTLKRVFALLLIALGVKMVVAYW